MSEKPATRCTSNARRPSRALSRGAERRREAVKLAFACFLIVMAVAMFFWEFWFTYTYSVARWWFLPTLVIVGVGAFLLFFLGAIGISVELERP